MFPAFDSNYKTRKRTFRCCENCRAKRVKCDISSTDYEVVGCLNCQKHEWKCSLIKLQSPQEKYQADSSSVTSVISKQSSLPSESEKITSSYLKLNFNFNCQNNSRDILTYLYHGHPKAVIELQENRYHESGVYIRGRHPESVNDGTYRNSDLDVFYIRNRKVYDFLCSIDAFTLSSKEYPITPHQTTELLRIFFYKLNSIFPIVYEEKFWYNYYRNDAQNSILYAIILVTLRDKLAEPILRQVFLTNFGELTQSQYSERLQSFMTDLEYKLRQILLIQPQLGDEDKVSRIVVSLLLCLHYSFDRLGNEICSHDLTDAINLAVALGIHMKSFVDINPQLADYTTHLWWCCYIFDRINGIVNSRCLFIRADDFNVDLPYDCIELLKLVQLARTIENMVTAIYRPFNTNATVVTKNRYKMFNSEDFQKMEFDFCDKERGGNSSIYDLVVDPKLNNGAEYVLNTIHFLTRVINNSVIMVAQKAKYDDSTVDNSVPEQITIRAALNLFWYFGKMKDESLINIPVVPWSISVAMAVALKLRTRKYLGIEEISTSNLIDFTWEDSIESLERFASSWWIIADICKLSREFISKMANNSQNGIKRIRKTPRTPRTSSRKKFKSDSGKSLINSISQNSLDSNELSGAIESNMALELPEIPITMDISEIQYDKYFESMQIDVFNNDFFEDVPTT